MAWKVLYTDEFGEWFEDQQDAVIARVELLEEHGPALGRPIVDSIAGSRHSNMKELRVSAGGALRVLFAFDPARQAILLIGGDKAAQWSEWYAERFRKRTICSTLISARPANTDKEVTVAVKRFEDLSERVKGDPERAARIAYERAAAVGEIVVYTLAQVRRARQVTQHELARVMATSQPNVSRIEHADEVELTTLRRYVEALGGRLEVAAVFDDHRLPLAVGD